MNIKNPLYKNQGIHVLATIFTIDKECKNLEFDNYKFEFKNEYTTYLQFNNKEFYNGNFLNTDIKNFLDKYFSKEIGLIEEYNKNNYNKVKKLIK